MHWTLASVLLLLSQVLLLFAQEQQQQQQRSFNFSVASREQTRQKLRQDFLFPPGADTASSALVDAATAKDRLRAFQLDLLKKRNAECFISTHGSVSEAHVQLTNFYNITSGANSTETLLWQQLLNAWYLFDEKKSPQDLDAITNCLDSLCVSSNILYDLFVAESEKNTTLNYENVAQLILTQLNNRGCDMCVDKASKSQVTRFETWVYGILFVFIISLSSLCGAFVIPLNNKTFYKRILMFLISLAVGSLAGSGLLHLIPQAFGIAEDPRYMHDYIWKSLVIMGGVYLFYVVEKVMKIMIQRKKLMKKRRQLENGDESGDETALENLAVVKTHEKMVEPTVEMRTRVPSSSNNNNNDENNNALAEHQSLKKNRRRARSNSSSAMEEARGTHGHTHGFENLHSVAPVAWMIIFGDGLHNFIDGLSIGAAFTESIYKGISISLAVICEEFPHELGDFAILINAGMSYPIALFFNFLSACTCFIGLAVGIVAGGQFGANQWIYAIAGGMFIYISLCDMIPELNELGEDIERDWVADEKRKRKLLQSPEDEKLQQQQPEYDSPNITFKIKVLLLQNLGIIIGFSFMFVMALFSESLSSL